MKTPGWKADDFTMNKYTHLELNKDVPAPSGYYVPEKEIKLKYDGREVLYVLSHATIESSCCGAADYDAAMVPGFILHWQSETGPNGAPVTEVEPINDEKTRDDVRKIIKEAENVSRTEFW
jgi:hypothetical protein